MGPSLIRVLHSSDHCGADICIYVSQKNIFFTMWLSVGNIHLLYEPAYVIPSVGNLMEEKSFVSKFGFPTCELTSGLYCDMYTHC
jgi:hypothetical protein